MSEGSCQEFALDWEDWGVKEIDKGIPACRGRTEEGLALL